jgi:protein-tyrosine phosphatase
MKVNIYWIVELRSARIGIMSRPRGGDWLEDEMISLCESHVDAVVSLLEPDEISELDLEQEEFFCRKHGMAFYSFSIPDRNIPSSMAAAQKFVQQLMNLLSEGKSLVIHCRQGIGRSSMIAACALVKNGDSVAHAFETIELARGCQVPDTQEQRDWVGRFFQLL